MALTQLKTIKNLFDAITSFDLSKGLLSKNYQHEAFNGVTDLAELGGERYAEALQVFFVEVTKFDVSTQQWRAILNPVD